MTPRRLGKPRGWWTLAVGTLMLLVGCAGSPASAKPAATLTPGQQVLQRARAARLTDATFTLTAHTTPTLTEDPPNLPSTFAGQGTLTTHPRRVQATYRIVSGDVTGDAEDILDYATATDYMKDSVIFPGADGWVLQHGIGPQVETPQSVLAYLQLTDATLVGQEQVSGVPVWHIRGTLTDRGETGVIDAYLARDTYLPVEETLHVTLSDMVEDETYAFTAVNTGVTIALPPPDRVAR